MKQFNIPSLLCIYVCVCISVYIAAWILYLSSLPPDSRPWFPNEMQNLLSSENFEDFGPLSNSPVLFLHSPGKMLLKLSLVQKWLGSPFPEDVWAWWLLMHWLQLQFTPCEALTSVWISLLVCILKLAVIPVACVPFPTQFLPSSQLCI